MQHYLYVNSNMAASKPQDKTTSLQTSSQNMTYTSYIHFSYDSYNTHIFHWSSSITQIII